MKELRKRWVSATIIQLVNKEPDLAGEMVALKVMKTADQMVYLRGHKKVVMMA